MGFRIPTVPVTPNQEQNTQSESISPIVNISTPNVENVLESPVADIGAERAIASKPAISEEESYNRAIDFATGRLNAFEKTTAPVVEPSEDSYSRAIELATNKPIDSLQAPKVLARNIDLQQGQNILDIAEKLNITPAEASARLSITPLDELKATPELTNIEKDYPGVATWARDPERYKILLKDPAYIKKVEDYIKSFDERNSWGVEKYSKDAFNALAGGLSSGINAPVARLPELVYSLASLPQNLAVKALGRPDLQVSAPSWLSDNSVAKYYDEQTKTYTVDGLDKDIIDSMKEKITSGKYAEAGRELSLRLIQNSPSNVAAIIGAMSGIPTQTLVGLGMLQGSTVLKESKEAGAEPIAATLNALYAGTFESLMEQMGTFGIFRHWEGVFAKSFGRDSAKKLMGEMVKGIAYSAASEGNEEFWTSIGQDFSAYSTGVNPNAMEGSLKRAAGSGLLGAISGPTMIAPGAITSGYVRSRNIQETKNAVRAVQAKETIQKAREDKIKSEVPKAHPQQTADLINQINIDIPPPIPQEAQESDNQLPPRPAFAEFNIVEFEEESRKLGRAAEDVARELGPNALNEYNKSKDNEDTHFKISIADYHRYSDNLPEFDDIMYVNGSSQNARSGMEAVKESLKEPKRELPTSMEQEVGEPPSIPGEQEGPTVFFPETEPQEGDPVLRHIQLLQKGRSEDEQKIYRELKNSIRRSTKEAGISVEQSDLMAEFQFRNTRFRAEQLGLPISEVAAQMKVGLKRNIKSETAYTTKAYFKPGTDSSGAPRNSVIFSNKTTANTLIHEFSHSWLHNMTQDWNYINGLLTRTENQQNYFEVMESTAKMLGLKSIDELNNIPDAMYEKLQETFARTGEKYFLYGEFGDSKIRKVFEAMRKWMASAASIINSILRQYPAMSISPEVSRVFQTILEGNSTVDENMNKMFPDPLFAPEVMGPKAEQYANALADARDQALAQMYSKFYTKSNKEREAEITKAIADIDDRAIAQVESLPAIKLMRLILSSDENKITHQSVLEVLAGNDEQKVKEIKALTAKGVIAGQKKIGVDIRQVMLYMNINDPKEMLGMLQQMGQRDELIDQVSNRLIDEEFPIVKSDEDVHKAAVDAINNSGRSKVLSIELEKLAEDHLKTLQKMSGTVALPPKMIAKKSVDAIRNQAVEIVKNAKALMFNPKDFSNRISKHGRDAAKYLTKGDFEKAFWEKQQEAVNYHAYKEGSKAFILVNKTLKLMKRFSTTSGRDIGVRYDADIYEYGKMLVHAMSIGVGLPELNTAHFENRGILDNSRVQGINNKIAAINQSLVGINAKDISVESMISFGEVLSLVQHAASATKKLALENIKEDVDTASETINNEILSEAKENDPTTSMTKGLVAGWTSSIKNVRTLFAGLMPEEVWAKSLFAKAFRSVEDAQAKFHVEKNIDEEVLVSSLTEISKDDPTMQGILSPIMKRFSRVIGVDTSKPIPASELNHTFKNAGEIHQMILYMGSESGRVKFALGGLIKEDGSNSGPLGSYNIETGLFETPAIDRQIALWIQDGTLKEAHFNFYQTVWDIYARHYEAVKKAVRHVDGFEPGFIEARKIQTPWKTYDGGYVPLSRDASYADAQEKVSDFITDNPGTPIRELFPYTNTSMTKEREKSTYPLSLNLSQLRNQLNAVYRIAYLRPTMFDFGKILDSSSFRQAIETRRPGAMNAMIKPWFQRTMAQQYSVISEEQGAKALDRVVRHFRKAMRVKAFIGNHVTFMKQYLGLFPVLNKIDNRLMMRAASEVGFSPSKAIDRIASMSDRMAVRFNENERIAVKSFEDFTLGQDWIEITEDKIERMTYAPIQWAQNHVDAIIFYAAIEQGKKIGLTDQNDLNGYAADIVESTQMTANISSRPSIMHGSEAKKLISDFMSVPLAMYGLIDEARSRNLDASTINKAKALSFVLLTSSILPSIIGILIAKPGKLLRTIGGDEDPEDYLMDMASDIAADLRDVNFPILGRAVWGLLQGDIARAFPVAQAARPIGTAARAIISPINPLDEKDEVTPADYRAMLDAITATTLIPTSVLNRGFKVLIDINPDLDPNR